MEAVKYPQFGHSLPAGEQSQDSRQLLSPRTKVKERALRPLRAGRDAGGTPVVLFCFFFLTSEKKEGGRIVYNSLPEKISSPKAKRWKVTRTQQTCPHPFFLSFRKGSQ